VNERTINQANAEAVVLEWRRAFGPALAALILYSLLVLLFVSKHASDPSSLVCAGKNRIGRPPYEAITMALGPTGDDGQFYYSLARSPWRAHGSDIDYPPYRHLRILYPVACWLCSGGHARLLFYVMPAVNLLAIAALAGVGGILALAWGRSAWWGLLLPFAVNSGSPLMHNFTDCFSNLAAFGLVAAWLLRCHGPALVLWAAAAAFSREQNLAIIAVVAAAALGTRRFKTAAGLGVIVLAWCAWAGLLWATYGDCPLLFGGGNFNAPLTGLSYRWSNLGHNGDDHFSRRLAIIQGLSVLHLSLMIPLAAYLAWRSQSKVVASMLLLGAALAVMGGTGIYTGFNSYMRVFAWMPMGIWLGAVPTAARWPLLVLSPAVLWSLVAALGFV
jgi:hypothetical protein